MVGSIAVVAILFAIFGGIMWYKADKQTKIANTEKLRSEKLYIEAKNALDEADKQKKEREKVEINNLIKKLKV